MFKKLIAPALVVISNLIGSQAAAQSQETQTHEANLAPDCAVLETDDQRNQCVGAALRLTFAYNNLTDAAVTDLASDIVQEIQQGHDRNTALLESGEGNPNALAEIEQYTNLGVLKDAVSDFATRYQNECFVPVTSQLDFTGVETLDMAHIIGPRIAACAELFDEAVQSFAHGEYAEQMPIDRTRLEELQAVGMRLATLE